MRRFVPVVCAILFVGAASVFAASGPSTKNVTLNFKGTGTVVNPTAQCTTGFSNVCPSGTCQCVEVTGATVTGNVKALTVSDFFVTIDTGTNLADAPSPDMSEPNQKCNPIFGSVTVSNSEFDATLNIAGVSCKHFVGISSKNPSGTHDKDILGGGWGISASPAPSPGASGGGLLTGTVTQSSQAVAIKMSGQVSR
jgi:hypothetical protein